MCALLTNENAIQCENRPTFVVVVRENENNEWYQEANAICCDDACDSVG